MSGSENFDERISDLNTRIDRKFIALTKRLTITFVICTGISAALIGFGAITLFLIADQRAAIQVLDQELKLIQRELNTTREKLKSQGPSDIAESILGLYANDPEFKEIVEKADASILTDSRSAEQKEKQLTEEAKQLLRVILDQSTEKPED